MINKLYPSPKSHWFPLALRSPTVKKKLRWGRFELPWSVFGFPGTLAPNCWRCGSCADDLPDRRKRSILPGCCLPAIRQVWKRSVHTYRQSCAEVYTNWLKWKNNVMRLFHLFLDALKIIIIVRKTFQLLKKRLWSIEIIYYRKGLADKLQYFASCTEFGVIIFIWDKLSMSYTDFDSDNMI